MCKDLRLSGICMQTFYPWASLTTRLWEGAEHLEVEWTVGPIPFKDGLGREISVRPSAFPAASCLHGRCDPLCTALNGGVCAQGCMKPQLSPANHLDALAATVTQ